MTCTYSTICGRFTGIVPLRAQVHFWGDTVGIVGVEGIAFNSPFADEALWLSASTKGFLAQIVSSVIASRVIVKAF